MSKHAPGPWSINETHCVIYDRDEKYVGQAFKIWLNNKERDEERALANARLIAAAPELLEALKVCSAELFAQCADHPRAMLLVEEARAAIAKAEGGNK